MTQKSQREWLRSAKDVAADQLLATHNWHWLPEGKKALTRTGFKRKLTLDSLTADRSGKLTFYFSDGGLFHGHSVRVGGDVETGLTSAEI